MSEGIDNLFCHPITEIFLLMIVAYVEKWQDSNRFDRFRFFIFLCCTIVARDRQPIVRQCKDLHCLIDILKFKFSKRSQLKLGFVFYLVAYGFRDQDSAGYSQTLNAGRYVNAIAKDITVVNQDVTEMDADANGDLQVTSEMTLQTFRTVQRGG